MNSIYLKRSFSLFVFCLFVAITNNAFSITIDDFHRDQVTINDAPGGGNQTSGILEAYPYTTMIKGARTLAVNANSGDPLEAARVGVSPGLTNTGILKYSQDTSISGQAVATWDGDDNAATFNPLGLGGINFTQDGSTAVEIQIYSFDWANQQPITLQVTVYSSATNFSTAAIVLNESIGSMSPAASKIKTIPFASFAGTANFNNIGAVTLLIDANNAPDVDLSIDSIGTNTCSRIPDQNGKVVDACNVCNDPAYVGPPGTSCWDCLGVVNGTKKIGTACTTSLPGVCNPGTYNNVCSCIQVEIPTDEKCDGLDNDCNGSVDINADKCNVCGGNCKDCKGVLFGTAALDRCGVCDGNGQSCIECNTTNLSSLFKALDGVAKDQEKVTRQILHRINRLGRNKPAVKKYISQTAQTSHALQLENWIRSWTTMPTDNTQCKLSPFCVVSQENAKHLNDYIVTATKHRDLGLAAINKLKSLQKGKLSAGDLKLKKIVENLLVEGIKLAKEAPATHYTCT